MSFQANDEKNIICPICKNGKHLKLSYYLTSHQQTTQHKKALLSNNGIQYKNDGDSRKILAKITNDTRKKQVEAVGIEKVREKEAFKKFNQRLKNKGENPLTLEQYKARKGTKTYENKQEKDLNKIMVEIRQAIKVNNTYDTPTIEYVEKSSQKVVQDDQDFNVLISEIEKQAKKKGENPNMNTAIIAVKEIYKKMYKAEMNYNKKGLDWLKNHEENIDWVMKNYSKINTQTTKISRMSVMCKYLHEFKDAYMIYSQVSTDLNKHKQKQEFDEF